MSCSLVNPDCKRTPFSMRINMLPVINRPFSHVNTLGVGKLKWTERVLQVLRISNVFAIMPKKMFPKWAANMDYTMPMTKDE